MIAKNYHPYAYIIAFCSALALIAFIFAAKLVVPMYVLVFSFLGSAYFQKKFDGVTKGAHLLSILLTIMITVLLFAGFIIGFGAFLNSLQQELPNILIQIKDLLVKEINNLPDWLKERVSIDKIKEGLDIFISDNLKTAFMKIGGGAHLFFHMFIAFIAGVSGGVMFSKKSKERKQPWEDTTTDGPIAEIMDGNRLVPMKVLTLFNHKNILSEDFLFNFLRSVKEYTKTPVGVISQIIHYHARYFATILSKQVLAQFQIAIVNTAFVCCLIFLILPFFDVYLELRLPVALLTFLISFIPALGNVIANFILFLLCLVHGLWIGIFAIVFMIVVHKVEYFINAKIFGKYSKSQLFEMLLFMLAMEAMVGTYGLIVAPALYSYLKFFLLNAHHFKYLESPNEKITEVDANDSKEKN